MQFEKEAEAVALTRRKLELARSELESAATELSIASERHQRRETALVEAEKAHVAAVEALRSAR